MEIPSANLHGTALGLARMLGVVADGGALDGRSVLSAGTLEQLMRERTPRAGQGAALYDQLGGGVDAQRRA